LCESLQTPRAIHITNPVHDYLTAEISSSAVAANLALLRGRLAPGTKLCAVVKANCYGLGVELLLDTVAHGADWLAVAAPVEAIQVRDLGYAGPLLVLFSCLGYSGHERQEALEELIRRRVTLTIASPEDIGPISQAARGLGAPADVHLKIDSGMGRSGVPPHRALAMAEAIRAAEGLRLAGIYTHFATADDADPNYMREQLRQFRSAAEAVPGRDELLLHAANSAAAIGAADSHLDMVRCGLAVYGYQPAEQAAQPLALRPALRVWGRLLMTKNLPSGASVGGGRTCTLQRNSTVGVVPIGYADGYFRCLAPSTRLGASPPTQLGPGGPTMRVAGRDVPVLGAPLMDETFIDLTDAPGAKAGDVVEIISPDPSAPHSVENLAILAGTIPYEVTCRLGPRARRVLTQD
jgi:alanine racemase